MTDHVRKMWVREPRHDGESRRVALAFSFVQSAHQRADRSDADDGTIASECDVVVIGAGPAGIAAAIHLKWLGRSVQVFDKAEFPRDKCCGDGLTALALHELERLQLHPSRVASWTTLDRAVLVSPSGREVVVPLPTTGTYAAVAPRRELDHALVQHARSIGVAVHEGVRFTGVTEHPDHLEVSLLSGESPIGVATRYVIAADGAWSPVRKAIMDDDPDTGDRRSADRLGEWHAFRQYADNVTGRAAQEMMIWFEPDLLPGYAWSFPLPDGRVNLGFGVLRDGRSVQAMAATWRDLLKRPHIAAALGPSVTLVDRHTAWPIPARIDRAPLAFGRVLFVGDAAGAADTLTGEGIGQALLTGRLAAAAVNSAGSHHPHRATSEYRRMTKHHLFADHRMSSRLSKILSTESGTERALSIVAQSGNWGRRNFARWLFEDEPRAIVLTPSRWHRNFLDRVGAYRS